MYSWVVTCYRLCRPCQLINALYLSKKAVNSAAHSGFVHFYEYMVHLDPVDRVTSLTFLIHEALSWDMLEALNFHLNPVVIQGLENHSQQFQVVVSSMIVQIRFCKLTHFRSNIKSLSFIGNNWRSVMVFADTSEVCLDSHWFVPTSGLIFNKQHMI